MNIVQVSGGELRIPVEKGGGSEEYILNISKCLAKMGNEVTILDRKYSSTDADVEDVDGVKIVRLKARKFVPPNLTISLTLNYISFARQVRKYLAKADFDVVHVHVSITGLFLVVMSPKLKKRLIYTSHATRRGKESLSPLDRMAISLENQLVKRVRTAIVLNDLVREGLITRAKVNPEKVAVLPMGTNTDRFNPTIGVGDIRQKYGLEGEVTILFVGRIRADKGIEYLVKAANIVVNVFGCKQAQFILVGPTEEFVSRKNRGSLYLDKVKRLIEDFGLQVKVKLTGAVPLDDLRRLYVACDIFVLPSLTEAAPQALVEAMASGKPVIGTMVGSVPMQIKDGQSGFLIDPGNESQLAEKIKYLIDNPAERERMGAYGRKLAEEEFDWSKITERLLQVY
jgi:glycosyltransferase involved in cell wall biosynthesis